MSEIGQPEQSTNVNEIKTVTEQKVDKFDRLVTVDAKAALAFHFTHPDEAADQINPKSILHEPVNEEEKAAAKRKTEKLIALLQDEDLGGDVGGHYFKRIATQQMYSGEITQEQYVNIIDTYLKNRKDFMGRSISYAPIEDMPEFEEYKRKYGEKRVVGDSKLPLGESKHD